VALDMLAQAEAQGRPFDLLLSDMQMPEMDGYTLAQTLRARGRRLPIVALTAHALAEDRDRCLAAGCNDYAAKPIPKSRLLELCAKWIRTPPVDATTRTAA
jgi:CheY-like chemotaxis protein